MNSSLARDTAPSVRETTVFEGIHHGLTGGLDSCVEHVNRIEAAIDRLLNPDPRSVGDKAEARPENPPQTVEARFNVASRRAHEISVRLDELATRLERAA